MLSVSAKVTSASLEHPVNALLPIDVTADGIVMEVRLLQLRNASFPIDVTVDGISMEVSPLHHSNV